MSQHITVWTFGVQLCSLLQRKVTTPIFREKTLQYLRILKKKSMSLRAQLQTFPWAQSLLAFEPKSIDGSSGSRTIVPQAPTLTRRYNRTPLLLAKLDPMTMVAAELAWSCVLWLRRLEVKQRRRKILISYLWEAMISGKLDVFAAGILLARSLACAMYLDLVRVATVFIGHKIEWHVAGKASEMNVSRSFAYLLGAWHGTWAKQIRTWPRGVLFESQNYVGLWMNSRSVYSLNRPLSKGRSCSKNVGIAANSSARSTPAGCVPVQTRDVCPCFLKWMIVLVDSRRETYKMLDMSISFIEDIPAASWAAFWCEGSRRKSQSKKTWLIELTSSQLTLSMT